jgi:hypothetical protein
MICIKAIFETMIDMAIGSEWNQNAK